MDKERRQVDQVTFRVMFKSSMKEIGIETVDT